MAYHGTKKQETNNPLYGMMVDKEMKTMTDNVLYEKADCSVQLSRTQPCDNSRTKEKNSCILYVSLLVSVVSLVCAVVAVCLAVTQSSDCSCPSADSMNVTGLPVYCI